jgi:hypothetical protein
VPHSPFEFVPGSILSAFSKKFGLVSMFRCVRVLKFVQVFVSEKQNGSKAIPIIFTCTLAVGATWSLVVSSYQEPLLSCEDLSFSRRFFNLPFASVHHFGFDRSCWAQPPLEIRPCKSDRNETLFGIFQRDKRHNELGTSATNDRLVRTQRETRTKNRLPSNSPIRRYCLGPRRSLGKS